MHIRNIALIALLICLLSTVALSPAVAVGLMTVTVTPIHSTLFADGKHSTTLRAEVRDSSGRPVTGSVMVQFTTTQGTLSQTQAPTIGGIATVTLTSAPVVGVANVTATVPGQGVAQTEVVFTDDPEATFEGNNYLSFVAAGYLEYSVTDKIIEGLGKNGTARMTYRNLELTADDLQLRCEDLIVRAHGNVTLKRGRNVLHATRLYYSLASSQGYAIAQDDNGDLHTVSIHGDNLRTEPNNAPIPPSYINLPTLQVKLVIVARSITYFPGDRLQFRQPHFFQDTVQIMRMPYYELPLYTQELFSDQFISVGTSGLGLDLPYYFSLTPHGSTIAYLRHQQQLGRGYFATQPGWAIDLVRGYSSDGDHRFEGAYGFTDLTRSNWSFRWTHNQQFNSGTQGSFDLEFPSHDSIFSSANLTQQFRFFRWGANLAAGQTFVDPLGYSTRSDLYAETIPHRLAGSKSYMYTLGTTFSSGQSYTRDTTLAAGTARAEETVEGLNLHAFSRPLALDKHTTLTNSFTLGPSWSDAGNSGLTALMTLQLDHTLKGGGTIDLTYDFIQQPSGLLPSTGKHRISANYIFASSRRFQASLFSSIYLDVPDSSVLADLSYRLDNRWRIITSATLQKFGDLSYRDIEFTVGRRIGARELQVTYSTLYKRFSVDMTATRF